MNVSSSYDMEALQVIASELEVFLDACLQGESSEKSSFWRFCILDVLGFLALGKF